MGVWRKALYGALVASAVVCAMAALGVPRAIRAAIRSAASQRSAHAPEVRASAVRPVFTGSHCVLEAGASGAELRDVRGVCKVSLYKCWIPGCVDGQIRIGEGGALLPPGRGDYPAAKPADTLRILVLGGSTSAGMVGPELVSNWPIQLERALGSPGGEAERGERFEVINGALAGYDSRASEAWLRNFGRNYADVDILVLGEEVNDLFGCAALRGSRAGDGASAQQVVESYLRGDAETTLDAVAALGPWFERHRAFLVEQRERAARERWVDVTRAALLGERDRDRARLGEWIDCDANRRDPASEPLGSPSVLDDFEAGWRHTEASYARIVSQARARGIRTIVVSTTPYDFADWRVPTPDVTGCGGLAFTSNDWFRYVTIVHNPGVRRFAASEGLVLADLEAWVNELDHERRRRMFPCEWMHTDGQLGPAYLGGRYAELIRGHRAVAGQRADQRD
ncbi:MAG: hypothetical protein U0610_16455 [bacterium]